MTVLVEPRGAVLLVTIDRPDVLNSIDKDTSDALVAAWQRADLSFYGRYWTADPGPHNLTVIIDPGQTITETNEIDNQLIQLFTVAEGQGGIVGSLRSDVNDDTVVDIVDAMFVVQFANGNRASLPSADLCDVGHNDLCDIVDSTFIAQHANCNREVL